MKLKRSDTRNNIKSSLFKNSGTENKIVYRNIKDVVDKARPFSMMFSGVEDRNNFNILYNMGIRNFLMSYHYIQKKKLNTNEYEDLGVKFFIDSGAFTFMSSIEHQQYSIEDWERYIEKYLTWIEKHKSIIFACASLDIEYLVGGEQVQKWNERYFEPFMLRTGIPVCFVYHDNATVMSWEQYCQRYPYVGISWGGIDTQGNDLNYGINHLKIAEKYNTLVHGMAMTHTTLLTKLPFYTVDSTTWLVGLQYGEINFWNGKKMSRLKKDVWKGSMLSQLVQKGFNEQKLLEEDVEEMIRINVFAFIEAEHYIQEKLKSRMYWLKPEGNKRSEEDLNIIKYPSVEWLEMPHGQRPDIEKYAKEFNISTTNIDEAESLITDMTCFMNWGNPEYTGYIQATYTPELLSEIHNAYINRIVQTDDERVADLMDFFKRNLMGEDTTLLYLGTNFDRVVKEREDSEYITDEEYDYVDVPDIEMDNFFAKYLPAPKDGSKAPEIDELDGEIFEEAGIIPVRDAEGKFLKGQKAVARPKKLYSKKYPKLACDTCFNAQKCPEYKAGYACAYNKMFDRFDTRDMGDIIQAMQGIVDYSLTRLQRGMLTETLEGGLPDANVTNMMNQSMGYLAQLQKMYEYGSQEVLKQTKIMRADGSQEITTQLSNPQQGGILAKIFGDMSTSEEKDKQDFEEAEVVETKENSED